MYFVWPRLASTPAAGVEKDRAVLLFEQAVEWLLAHKVLLPGVTVLERFCRPRGVIERKRRLVAQVDRGSLGGSNAARNRCAHWRWPGDAKTLSRRLRKRWRRAKRPVLPDRDRASKPPPLRMANRSARPSSYLKGVPELDTRTDARCAHRPRSPKPGEPTSSMRRAGRGPQGLRLLDHRCVARGISNVAMSSTEPGARLRRTPGGDCWRGRVDLLAGR